MLLMLLLDNELDGAEKAAVESHIESCRSCRETYNKERWFSECVKRAQPLYPASDALRRKIASILSSPDSFESTKIREKQVHSSPIGATNSSAEPLLKRLALPIAASFLLLIAVTWNTSTVWRSSPITQGETSFSAMASDTHRRHSLGLLPLELESNNAADISIWFEGKVPFSVTLPNYQQLSGQDKLYELKGARLVGYKEDYAAYVSYEMEEHPVSLIMTSSNVASVSGGQQVKSKNIVFHNEAIGGYQVMSWSHRGLTYALVSNLTGNAKQSCVVCHQGSNDQNFLSLKF